MKRLLCTLLLLAVITPSTASAKSNKLQWNDDWPRFAWWEAAATISFFSVFAYTEFGTYKSDKPKWNSPILFDTAFRDALRMPTRSGRETANEASDVFWGMTYAFPIVDIAVISLLVQRDLDLAWQLLSIGLEAYALSAMLARVMHRSTRRARPLVDACRADSSYDTLCGGTGSVASFWSGHFAMAATGAGLTCVHHRYLPLYGSDGADAGACSVAILTATLTGMMRVMADRHYMTDLVVGGIVGFGIGYSLPWLLHYRYGKNAKKPTRRTALIPYGSDEELGLSVMGLW